MQVAILCGGKGLRSFPFNSYLPKPLLPLRGTPIVVHLIRSFIAQGFREFVLLAGYRKAALDDYFDGKDLGADIAIVDTGEDANTGERLYACRDLLGPCFVATYADGLCDVPFAGLLGYHRSHGGPVTVTTVPLRSQYGVLSIASDGAVTEMREKPVIDGAWVNAGFMVIDQSTFATWRGADLEREVLPNLIARGLVHAYRHRGFFKSADSYKDVVEFEALMQDGRTPWVNPHTSATWSELPARSAALVVG